MLPLIHEATHAPYIGGVDAHGARVDGWSDPQAVDVYGWAQAGTPTSATDLGRNLVTNQMDIFAPAGLTTGDRDRWTLDGVAYLQTGPANDLGRGPWGWEPGVVIRVEKET